MIAHMKRHVSPWIALVVGLALTIAAYLEVKESIEQDAAEEFAFTSDQVTLNIQERLDAYALILKGGASLFAASNTVGRSEWQAYVETLRAQDSVPGVQGIGFSQVIPPHQLAAHIARIRAEGFPDYTVRPAGERALYTSIIYLEPFRERNLRAFGFDMFSEPVRRAAMERARDSGAPALSGKVELVQETGEEVQAGTLMYVPIYRNGAPVDTVEKRRSALIGWAYSPYRMKDLLEGILANWDDHKTKRVHLQIYAGLEVKADSLLYDSHSAVTHEIDPLFYQQRTIDFDGQHWLLAFHAGESVAPISYASAWATLAGGFVLSSLLYGLMLALARQVRAREFADTQAEEIRRSEDLLNTSQRLSMVGGWAWNVEAQTMYWTEEAYRIHDFELGEIESGSTEHITRSAECYGPEDRPLVLAAFHRCMEDGEPYDLEFPFTTAKGRQLWVRTTARPVSESGKIVRVIGNIMDITERKRAEKDRYELTERYRLANKATNDVIWDWDVIQDTQRWNEVGTAVFGWTEIVEHPVSAHWWVERVHPDDQERVHDSFFSVVNNPEHDVWHDEYRFRKADGAYAEVMDRGYVMRDAQGKAIRMIGAMQDITERKQTEAELQRHRQHLEELVEVRTAELSSAKEAAEAANRAKGQFLSNMSHELRTPMNAIMGMTNIALRRATEPQLVDKLTKIDNASRHLLSVINDILDISKIEAERLTLERVSFKFGLVLENLMSMVGQRAAEKGLALLIDLPPEIARQSFLGDPLRLGQILLNLTGNAVKFTVHGSITVRIIKLEETPADVLLRCEVLDTGIGISREDQQRLFTAFEQADGSMTRKYGGTGLGLVISRRLAELMGGDIALSSASGQGSTFRLTVRLDKATDAVLPAPTFAEESAEAQLHARHAGARILLAEDEPVNQEVSRSLLEDVGLTVELAEDGGAAVAMAQRSHYDLILMDMQMPQMNGIEATRIIRALPAYADTPILAMTANAFAEDRQVCLDAGMDDHIGKPVDPDKLYETLLQWLDKRGN